MCQGQVGTFFECPDAHILWVDVHYQQHIPACALPSPFCQMREAQCTVLFLPAPSWKQHLLLPKNGQGDLQTPHSIPYLIPSYNLSHMTSFSHYLCTLQREELFFFKSLSERVLSIFSYMVTSTVWDLIGKLLCLVLHWLLRKLFYREVQQMLLVQQEACRRLCCPCKGSPTSSSENLLERGIGLLPATTKQSERSPSQTSFLLLVSPQTSSALWL